MKNTSILILVILVLLIGGALQFKHYYPLMPDPMAVHFGANMQADGWSARDSFFRTYPLVEIGLLIIMLAVVFLRKRIPTSAISLPHRGYWFAEGRREETWEKVSVYALGMGALTLAFMIAMAEVLFRANLEDTAVPSIGASFFWALGVFLGIVAVATISFYRHFSNVPQDPQAPPESA